ncbi:DUF1599 domain-containing protein [Halalkalibacterium halodurans]|uniref:DUF1599 domain-containing protein n=1 Tax=Halalkalibacterium halodurans TaxID=86665 RepID=UPI002E1CAD37|nr:DUF1599 domain-containing protein [Halalkalibacterium halodurans]
MAKYVRVVKASDPSLWYSDRIGEVFEFVDACADLTGGYYECKDGYRIRCKDAEAVTVYGHEGGLYAEVDRLAEVGDTVLVTKINGKDTESVAVVKKMSSNGTVIELDRDVLLVRYLSRIKVNGDQYRVLEPLIVSVPFEAPKSTDDIVANLTRRMYEAEERIDALETGQRVLHKMTEKETAATVGSAKITESLSTLSERIFPLVHSAGMKITAGTFREDIEVEPPTSHLIAEVADEVRDLLIRKNGDYGDSFSKQYDEYGLMSSLIRMDDKIQRLKTLESGHEAQVDESIDDTLRDLAGYAILTLVARKEKNSDEN